MSKSNLKKYINTDDSGKESSIPYLYIDTVTGTFYVRVYDRGGTKSRSLNTKSFALAKMRINAAVKKILAHGKKRENGKLVRDYYEEMQEAIKTEELSESTLQSYRGSWKNHIEPFWGNLNESDLTQAAYTEFLVWHKKKHGGKLFNPLKLLRKLLSFMRKNNAVFSLSEISLPKKETDQNKISKGTFIEKDEIKAILKTHGMRGHAGLMVSMSYALGFRLGELVNLKQARIKRYGEHLTIELEGEDTKTRMPRSVPLTNELSRRMMEHLESIKVKSDFVFPSSVNPKKPISKQAIDRIWIRAKKAAGIRRRIRYHDLRHTCATNLAELGVDPVKACTLLGMTLKIYSSTYVKSQSLNLNSVVEILSKRGF